MEKNSCSHLQKTILIIADEIDRICAKYNIPYSIYGGTLLGAVRHKGFIPWDDDFDVAMKREHFERFISVCKKELDSSKFFLQTENTELNYAFAFAKLQLVNTELIEDFSKNVPIHHGIFADIFALDNIPENVYKMKWMLFKNHILKNMIWVKCGYGEIWHKKKMRYKVLKMITFPLPINLLKRIRYKIITKYNHQKTKYVFVSDYPNNRLDVSWYKTLKKYKFEDREYMGLENYQDYLFLMYGDYMKLPPIEDRRVHTRYKVKFGSYDFNN